MVRVLFILGNLTTKSDETRHDLYFSKASTKYLLMVFQYYFERNVEVRNFVFTLVVLSKHEMTYTRKLIIIVYN